MDQNANMLMTIKKSLPSAELDSKGKFLEVSRSFADLLEYDQDEMVGQFHKNFVDAEMANSMDYKKFWNDVKEGISVHRDMSHKSKTGENLWLSLSAIPVRGANGEVEKTFLMAKDITLSKDSEAMAIVRSAMVDMTPINTMMCTPDGTITYVNDASKRTLKKLEQYMPIKVEEMVGKSFDIFHKVPEKQRKIVSNPNNLPHRAIIQLGPEKLDLLVSGIKDNAGNYLGAMVTWELVTEKIKVETEMMTTKTMVEKSPINTMMCNPEGIILYMNEASRTTLKKLEQFIPLKADQIVGKSFDIFHKDPEKQKKIISSPKNLPHRAIIQLGPERLDLNISAIVDNSGNYLGAMVNWEVVTAKMELIRDLGSSSEELQSAAGSLLNVSSSLSASAEETSAQANTASVASEEVNAGVQTVASNMEEMVASIKEITKTTNEASSIAGDAMKLALSANQIINQLGESSNDIGNVIKVISSIAQQTNLLALNATIEAARAGEAGKGFAVVANEVKELAKQTAKATSDITKKIETIQSDTKSAVEAIGQITKSIERVNGYASNIAASVEEQAATTNEVTRIVTESAEGVKQINENISQVSQAAANTGKDAAKAQDASKSLGKIAETLKSYVGRLKA